MEGPKHAKELLKNVALSGVIEKSSVVVKTNKRRACRIGDVLFIGTEISCLLMTTKI